MRLIDINMALEDSLGGYLFVVKSVDCGCELFVPVSRAYEHEVVSRFAPFHVGDRC